MITESRLNVLTDLRWPPNTGIGQVMQAAISFVPAHVNLIDLHVAGKIGSPFAPLAISRALAKTHAVEGVFWNAGFLPPLIAHVPSVVTVHDLTHLHYYNYSRRFYYNLVLKRLYRRCQAIICVSDYTRREFLAWSGMPANKVHLVYNGITLTELAGVQAAVFPFQYVLYAGNHRIYKNLFRLIEAFASSSLPTRNIHLIFTGPENNALFTHARNLGVASFIRFLGWLSQEELASVYRGALTIAFVSLYEGFGLPILEGMAAKVPVLTSNSSALPEVAGGAALIIDPFSVEEIAKGLDRLTTDEGLRSELIGRGAERVKQFDWHRSIAELWSIVDRVVNLPAFSAPRN